MKYQCQNPECKKIFIHTAKQTQFAPKKASMEIKVLSDKLSEESRGWINNQITNAVQLAQSELIETQVCPFCQSKEYTEFVEPAEEISSVKSVDLAQVDDYLKLGYKVKELYAKTATLVKMETVPKDANLTLKDVIKAGIEQAKQEAPQ